MARKPMLPSEVLVGRRLPKDSPHIDAYMAGYVSSKDGSFTNRFSPTESWLRPAHTRARRAGWIRYSGFNLKMAGERGKGTGLWHLTPAGEAEALAAKERVRIVREARTEWARDHQRALVAARRAKDDAGEERSPSEPVVTPSIHPRGATPMTTETGATTIEDLKTEANVTGASVGGFFAQGNYSDHDLIAATKVTNAKVYNKDGDKIGWLDEVVLEKVSGRVAYVVLAVGGFLGFGERYHRLPWERLVYDEDKKGYNIDLTGDEVRAAPHYSREEVHASGRPEVI